MTLEFIFTNLVVVLVTALCYLGFRFFYPQAEAVNGDSSGPSVDTFPKASPKRLSVPNIKEIPCVLCDQLENEATTADCEDEPVDDIICIVSKKAEPVKNHRKRTSLRTILEKEPVGQFNMLEPKVSKGKAKAETKQERRKSITNIEMPTRWRFYKDPGGSSGQSRDEFLKSMTDLGSFNSSQAFSDLLSIHSKDLVSITNHPLGTNIRMFRENVTPLREDPANANGGCLTIYLKHDKHKLKDVWFAAMIAVVSKQLNFLPGAVNGITLSIRSRGNIISFWTSLVCMDEQKVDEIKAKVCDMFDLDGVIVKFHKHMFDNEGRSETVSASITAQSPPSGRQRRPSLPAVSSFKRRGSAPRRRESCPNTGLMFNRQHNVAGNKPEIRAF
eukprot:Nk52_evm49s2192 gene=Nk52_evmTU49s2192